MKNKQFLIAIKFIVHSFYKKHNIANIWFYMSVFIFDKKCSSEVFSFYKICNQVELKMHRLSGNTHI